MKDEPDIRERIFDYESGVPLRQPAPVAGLGG
jgi:hypothetical protein